MPYGPRKETGKEKINIALTKLKNKVKNKFKSKKKNKEEAAAPAYELSTKMKRGGKIKKKKKKFMGGGKMYEYGHGGNIMKQYD